jgi:hypothetical protein
MAKYATNTWLLLPAFLLLNQCGGRAAEGSSSAGAGATGATGGTTGHPDECAGAATDGGCGGADGELSPYARLRTSCSHNTRVDRDAAPVSIDCQIR